MKIETSKLKPALEKLRDITGKRSTMPILSTVLVSAESGMLSLTANSLDECQIETVDCLQGEIKPACVNLNHLYSVIGEEFFELTQSGDKLKIKLSFGSFDLKTMDAAEFPKPEFGKVKGVGISCSDLSDAIARVAWACGTGIQRPAYECVHVKSAPKKLFAEGCDGKTIAAVTKLLICAESDFILTNKVAKKLSDELLRAGSKFSTSQSFAFVSHDAGEYACRLMDLTYPDTSILLGDKTEPIGEFQLSELNDIFGRYIALDDPAMPKNAFIKTSTDGMEIHFDGKNSNSDCKIIGKFPTLKFIVNLDGTKKALQNLKSDKVKVGVVMDGDEVNRIVFEDGAMICHQIICRK